MIDTPGSNDTYKKRTDQDIQFELINTVRAIFSSREFGVNALIMCVMPDKGGRLKLSGISAMCSMLLSLTSIYKTSDPKKHPKMFVVFNNVSKHNLMKGPLREYGQPLPSGAKPSKLITLSEHIQHFKDELLSTLIEHYVGKSN